MKLGIDFGTTNSAVAVVGPGGSPRILELAPGERVQRTVVHASLEGPLAFGNAAFRRYLDEDLTGRFLRSIKAFLPDDVPNTTLAGRRWSFPELITAYLQFLIRGAEAVLGERVTEVVVGRPVHFHADADKNAVAVGRLEGAIAAAVGDRRWSQVLEPVAAAYRYELGLTRERMVLVGDFGGGTSDFAVFRAGPGRTGDRLGDVIATSGVASAGDALDARFMDTFLMAFFGRGGSYRKPQTNELLPWTNPILWQIQRLYSLPLLRTKELDEGLQRLIPRMVDPTPIRRLHRLVFDDLGYPLAWQIEGTKRQFSEVEATDFTFDELGRGLVIARPVTRQDYAAGCAELLTRWDAAVDEVLAKAGLGPEGIDDVFLTGGTSQLPFVRDLFAAKFGAEKLSGADAFTSVCEGLALAGRV